MSKATETSHREHWLTRAGQVSRKVNLAWWLETLAAPLLILALVGSAAILLLRREAMMDHRFAAATIAGVLAILALACWARARRRFETKSQSLVRIEAAMSLRNALSAAEAGISPWPKPLGTIQAGLHWQWPRLLVPPLGALLLLAAGIFIPVTAREASSHSGPEQPQAWKQLDAELDHLTKEEVVDEKYLEETRKRLDELKAQEEEQWFSHSSLEATDSLKKSHQAESQRMERELGKAEKALANFEKNSATANQAEKNRMMEDFDQALQGLQSGAMKPNPALLEQMKGMDLKNMSGMSPEQMQQLRENLKKHAEAMKNGSGQGEGDDWSDELMGGEGEGEGEGEGNGEGDGEDGNGPGKGGINRGPGHDPNVLGKQRDGVETGELTGLEAKDLSRAAPGDLLELQDGEHDVDQSATRVREGGGTDATGKGGDRVWKESLDPSEQRTLKKFFE